MPRQKQPGAPKNGSRTARGRRGANPLGNFVVGTITTVTIAATGAFGATEPVDLPDNLAMVAPAAAVVQDAAVDAANEAYPSPTATNTATATVTPTSSPTATATSTPSPTASNTATATTTHTQTPTATYSPTPSATPSPTPMLSPLVGYWPLDPPRVEGRTGGQKGYALAGQGTDAPFFIAPNGTVSSYENRQADNSGALELDGHTHFAYLESTPLNERANFTIQLWVHWYGGTGQDQYLFYNGTAGEDGYGLLVNSRGRLQLAVGKQRIETNGRLAAAWQQITLVRTDEQWLLYQDSQPLVLDGQPTPIAPTQQLLLGARDRQGQNGFYGLLDELYLYREARLPGDRR